MGSFNFVHLSIRSDNYSVNNIVILGFLFMGLVQGWIKYELELLSSGSVSEWNTVGPWVDNVGMSEVGPSAGLMAWVPHLVSSTITEQEVCSSVAQRIIIKLLATKGIKPAEFWGDFENNMVNKTLSKMQVFHWHKQFFSGWKTVENQPHQRRPRTSVRRKHRCV